MQNPPSYGKQGLILEEMSQTLMTNKKQGLTLLSQRKFAVTARNTFFAFYQSLDYLKKLKIGRVPYLGLELTNDHICPQKPNQVRDTVPLKGQ